MYVSTVVLFHPYQAIEALSRDKYLVFQTYTGTTHLMETSDRPVLPMQVILQLECISKIIPLVYVQFTCYLFPRSFSRQLSPCFHKYRTAYRKVPYWKLWSLFSRQYACKTNLDKHDMLRLLGS